MNRIGIVGAAALFATTTCALANDDASAPVAGTYAGGVYIATSNAGCLDKSGYAYFAEMSFDGLNGGKHYIRIPLVGTPGAASSVQTLTVTSGKGTNNLSGNLLWTGMGVGANWNVTGTFSATITDVGQHNLVLQMKETYTNCSEEDWNVSLTRMGAFQ